MTAAVVPEVWLVDHDGRNARSGEHWWRPATAVDDHVLGRAVGPVLDIGCGPGRHALALGERGVPALGIDVTPLALAAARARGVSVLRRCIFDRVPGAGRWASALLLDGNIGISGDPVALLRRVASLLRRDGRMLVELGAPCTRAPVRNVKLEISGVGGPWFQWAHVAADDIDAVASAASLIIREEWRAADRWFATLIAGET